MAEFYVNICHQIDQFSIEMKYIKKYKINDNDVYLRSKVSFGITFTQ